jgi:hypothetical protein
MMQMSSLIFASEEQQAFFATDTLATSPEGEPSRFSTKAFIVPHLRMMMAGTGAGGFLGKWFVEVNDRMLVKGIDHLDYHTPECLVRIWAAYKQECSIPDSVTTTVYHSGFSEEDGVIHSYAYRSSNNFQSESLEYGLRVKPECDIPERYELPTHVKQMMDSQRAIQTTRPKADRVYVGGQIIVHHLTEQSFSVYVLDEFDDYETNERAMYENYAKR